MNNQNPKNQNRFWIIVNYFSLVGGLTLFYSGNIFGWDPVFLISGALLFAIFLFSLYKAYIVSKLWKMVHTPVRNLDERELQVVLNALRYAYSIFAISCLIIIYAFAIAGNRPIDVLMAGGLLYLAHTLPAAIVGWKEALQEFENE